MTITLNAFQKQRRDTASNWTSNNPTLLAGEFGYETDTKKIKIGDGSTAWQSLDYLPIPDTNRLLTGNLTVGGNFTVNGTTTTIDTTTLTVEDKNIEIGKVSSPSDTTADGGGLTLKGGTDKTFNWVNSTDSWTSSEHLDFASGKVLKIAGTQILSATALGSSVVSSSLTSLGTIATGVWQGTAIGSAYMTAGTTSVAGALQLTDSTTSTSTTTAATPNAVKTAKDAADVAQTTANAALPKAGGQISGNITCAGTETVDGRDLSVDGAKLDGIEASADVTDATNVNAAGAIMESDVDAKGDILVGTADNTVARLAVGTNGYVLKADSSTTTGLAWGVDSGGIANVVDDSSPQLGGNLDSNTRDIHLNNSGDVALRWQLSGTNKWSIFHNTSGSSNHLEIFDNHGNGTAAKFFTNGAVELYHDNAKMFETISSGVETSALMNFSGSGNKVLLGDNGKICLGGSNDLQIFHDSVDSYLNNYTGTLYARGDTISLNAMTTTDKFFDATDGGAANLYWDNSKKLETFSSGTKHYGQVWLPNSGDSVQWTGSSSNACLFGMTSGANSPTGSDAHLQFHHWNGSSWVKPFYFMRDAITLLDDVKLQCGNSADLRLYHDGSNSWITDEGTGSLKIRSVAGQVQILGTSNNHNMAVFDVGGASELYHDNSKKFETLSDGVNITGTLKVNGSAFTGGGVSSDAQQNTIAGTGAGAAFSGTSAINNTLFGYYAGSQITTGDNNVGIGSYPLANLVSGSNNIGIGDGAYFGGAYNGSIMFAAGTLSALGSYHCMFGSNSQGRVYNYYNSNASWTRSSDVRKKKDILSNTDLGLNFINDLRTVTYKWKAPSELPTNFVGYDASKTEHSHADKMYGFIAQEIKESLDKYNITDFNGWTVDETNEAKEQGISYEMFVIPLVKAVQELSAKVKVLEDKVAALEAA